jgi:deazaflavin-dependent oxidoreductase (nitroreductase family)
MLVYIWSKIVSNSYNDWNKQIIAEYRKNHGKVGGNFEGAPLLLLHTVGRRSGKQRVNPVMYLRDGERHVVFASKAGADTHPDWYENLKATPDVKIEVGDSTIEVHAEEVNGPEREKLYERQASIYPNFAEYQSKTKRVIPVIALINKRKM